MRAVLVFTILALVSCQDYTYLHAGSLPFTYTKGDGSDNTFRTPVTHSRVHLVNSVGLAKAYRYDTGSPDCQNASDCSVAHMLPNVKKVSQTFNNFRSSIGVHPKKINQLHLGVAAIFNHDAFRSAFNSTYTGRLARLVWPWDPSMMEPNTASMQTNPSTVMRGSLLGGTAGTNTSIYEINFVQSGDNSVLATGNYIPKLQYILNRVNGPVGTGPGTGKPKGSQAGTTPAFDLDPLYGSTATFSNAVAWDNTTGKIRLDDRTGFLPSGGGALIIVPEAAIVAKLLISEHNRYVDGLENITGLSPADKWHLARRWTIATWQSLLWYEYIPVTLGFDVLGPLPTFDPENHPKVNNDQEWTPLPVEVQAISHYAYSAFPESFSLMDENWQITHSYMFFDFMSTRPVSPLYPLLRRHGFEPLIRGAVSFAQEPIDLWFNNLGRMSSASTVDFMARMLARGRDIGMPTFNDVRRAWNLSPYASFDDFLHLDTEMKAALRELYNNDTENIDFWIGGLAEYSPEYHFSETWTIIYRQACTDIRDYDKYWFEGKAANFTAAEIDQLRNTKLSTLILRHFPSITKIQCAALFLGPKDCPSSETTPNAVTCPQPNTHFLVDGAWKLSWKNATAGSNAVTFTLSARTTGYVALGFPSVVGKMLGATAFIGKVEAGVPSVGIYHINQRQPCSRGVGVCPVNNSMYTISQVSGMEMNGTTTLTFTVSPVPVFPQLQNIIGSYGSKDELQYHGSNKGVGQIEILVDPPVVPPPTCPPTSSSLNIFDSSVFKYSEYLQLNPSLAADLDTPAKAEQHFVTFGLPSMLAGSVEFDPAFYLSAYSDVRQAWGDAAKAIHHYLAYGKKEGRIGSIFGLSTSSYLLNSNVFDSNFYLGQNPDLTTNGINTALAAQRHWLTFGAKEGRVAHSSFNVRTYLGKYADLAQAFGSNYETAIVHFVSFGRAEGRTA